MPKKTDAIVNMSETSGLKKLSVSYDENGIPTFDFGGMWTGRDLMTISRLLLRAYRRNQRTMRRTTPTTEATKEETT